MLSFSNLPHRTRGFGASLGVRCPDLVLSVLDPFFLGELGVLCASFLHNVRSSYTVARAETYHLCTRIALDAQRLACKYFVSAVTDRGGKAHGNRRFESRVARYASERANRRALHA
jgi:hypothetical protein